MQRIKNVFRPLKAWLVPMDEWLSITVDMELNDKVIVLVIAINDYITWQAMTNNSR